MSAVSIMSSSEVEVRLLQQSDVPRFAQLVLQVGWTNTEGDLQDLLKANPDGCLGAYLPDGKLVGTVIGATMGDRIGSLGVLITDKEYRRQGIAKKLFFKCLEILGDRNVYLTAVAQMAPTYAAWGVGIPVPHIMVTVKGVASIPQDFIINADITIKEIKDVKPDLVMEFDKTVSLVDRSNIMDVYFKSDYTCYAKCAEYKGKIIGYLLFRKGLKGVRLSSFYADTPEIAEVLFHDAVQSLEAGIYMNCGFSRANLDKCCRVYKQFGLTQFVTRDEGFCSKVEEIEFPWQKVYGVLEYFAMFY